MRTIPISHNGDVTTHFLVAYAKIIEDKKDGVFMQGVYLGGLGDDRDAAEKIARECTNSGRGNTTIIPRLFPFTDGDSILPIMNKAETQFLGMESRMWQAEQIYDRGRKK